MRFFLRAASVISHDSSNFQAELAAPPAFGKIGKAGFALEPRPTMSIPVGLRVGTSDLSQLLSCCALLHFDHVNCQAMWQFSEGVCENSVAGSGPARTQLPGIDRGLAMRRAEEKNDGRASRESAGTYCGIEFAVRRLKRCLHVSSKE